jgi:hypothetical protein
MIRQDQRKEEEEKGRPEINQKPFLKKKNTNTNKLVMNEWR